MRTAPDFRLPTQRGIVVSLSETLARAPAIVVFDGRTSAATCHRRLGELAARFTALRAAGLELIVALQDRPERVRRYIEEVGLPFNILVDPTGHVSATFGVRTRGVWRRQPRPTMFVVDPKGTIRARLEPPRGQWGDAIDQAINRVR